MVIYSGIANRVVIPVTVLFLLLMFGIDYTFHAYQLQRLEQERGRLQQQIEEGVRDDIDRSLLMLDALQQVIEHHEEVIPAVVQGDRQRLRSLLQSYFEEIRDKYGVTHVYFHDKQRVNLLRLHRPERFGDTISPLVAAGGGDRKE